MSIDGFKRQAVISLKNTVCGSVIIKAPAFKSYLDLNTGAFKLVYGMENDYLALECAKTSVAIWTAVSTRGKPA